MASNPFFVQSASYAPALRGLQDTLTGLRQERRIQDEMTRRQEREDYDFGRRQEYDELMRRALSPQGIVSDKEEFQESLMDSVLNPQTARMDRNIIENLGITTPEKQAEVSEFAEEIKNTADEGLPSLVKSRIEKGVAEGRDMRDTAELLTMRPEEVRDVVEVAGFAVDNEMLRQMYALDPERTRGFMNSLEGDSADKSLSVRLREFREWQAMPEGADKTALGRIIGATPRTASFEERLEFERGKADIKTAQKVEEVQKTETQTETGKAEVEKLKTQLADQQKKLDAAGRKEEAGAVAAVNDAVTAIDAIDGLLADENYKSIYGGVQGRLPTITQGSLDAEAKRDQVVGLLSLESRQKLKGQGTITDQEAATLERSATTLANPNISDEAARKEINRVRKIFTQAKSRALKNKSAISGMQAEVEEVSMPTDEEIFSKYGL